MPLLKIVPIEIRRRITKQNPRRKKGQKLDAMQEIKKLISEDPEIAKTNEMSRFPNFGFEYRGGITELYNSIIRSRNKKPKIMSIGPGLGLDLAELNIDLNSVGIESSIDVLSLQKLVNINILKLLNGKDYSQNVALEEIFSNPGKYKSVIRELLGKYDFLIAALSAGIYTNYSTHNCFFMFLMLAPQGEAYIDVNHFDEDKFRQMVKNHNKRYGTDLNFKIENVTKTIERIKITRIS